LPDVIANASDTHATIGTAFGAEHARSRRGMGAIEIEAQRYRVREYHLNRGAFLPTPPALSLLLSVAGVVGHPSTISWSGIAEETWALWDGATAEDIWFSLPGSMHTQLAASQGGLIEVVDGMPGVRSCVQKSFGTASLAAGGRFDGIVPKSRNAWLVVALRVSRFHENGMLASMLTLAGRFGVFRRGMVYEIRIGDQLIGSRPAAISDSHPLVIGLQVDNGEASARIWDASGFTSVSRLTMSDVLIPDSIQIGGLNSPPSLIYMIGYGLGNNVGDVMETVVGFLSC
jgi:hypothetical protein